MAEFKTDHEVEYATEESQPLTQLVVEAVADEEDVDPIALPPLYDVIDSDALNSLFRPQLQPSSNPPVGQVTFRFHGYEVRVTAAGRVDLTEA